MHTRTKREEKERKTRTYRQRLNVKPPAQKRGESNETRKNSERSREESKIGSNSLRLYYTFAKKKKKETKRNARTWCNKTCAFSDASAKDAIIAEAKTPKSKLLVDEADMRVYFRLFL